MAARGTQKTYAIPHTHIFQPQGRIRLGTIYFLRSEYGVKIGRTVYLKTRMLEYRSLYPFPWKLFHHFTTIYMFEAEYWLHRLFQSQRAYVPPMPQSVEWFNLDDDQINWIVNTFEINPGTTCTCRNDLAI